MERVIYDDVQTHLSIDEKSTILNTVLPIPIQNLFKAADENHEIKPAKLMMFHAKDDPNVPYKSVRNFAAKSGVKLNTLERGGHVSTDYIVRKYWRRIEKFFMA